MKNFYFIKKRLFDFTLSSIGLVFIIPIITPFLFLIWIQDFHSPFYISYRVGRNNKLFKIVKLRSMIIAAEKNGVDSTSANDPRITKVGKIIRKLKLDELTQLFNVFKGDMSFVGPRPNVERETRIYTEIENRLLKFKPGITDFSSIVFSDEAQILSDFDDPDIAYNQIIRPRKNHLALFYISNQSLFLDIKLILLTFYAFFSKKNALKLIRRTLRKLNASEDLINMANRKNVLDPMPPPGSSEIVYTRE